jgi:deoxyribodipyrimidine photolyase-related protein
MNTSASIIFPHQLLQDNSLLTKDSKVYLVEEDLFFKQYNFHKQKLVLHRASMKYYEAWLKKNKYDVEYIETHDTNSDIRNLIKYLSSKGISELRVIDPTDYLLLRRIKKSCAQSKIKLAVLPNPNFLTTIQDVEEYFSKKKTYFQTDFYTWQRKQRKVLLENDGKPVGGKWTFDAENRAKFPKSEKIPQLNFPSKNTFEAEAKEYIELHFTNNYGDIDGKLKYPITHKDAEAWLDDFLENRFEKFGIYEDAIVAKEAVLHHSVLTPMLNIGLLQPDQIIEKTLKVGQEKSIPLNSLEGFVRQIMGWREFIRIVYEREGVKQRTTNYWGFDRKIPPAFWTGETGIPPIDITIKKILETGYAHHIERLMVLGNFMLLCEFDPDEVHRWFMELFIDAYDWVMVPNVYGMTQFADGGLMTTKPYISGSNYLMKMSDYDKGEWQPIWDGLFWRFMHVQRGFFSKNPRLGMLLSTYDKMPKEKQDMHMNNAENYLQLLDNWNEESNKKRKSTK